MKAIYFYILLIALSVQGFSSEESVKTGKFKIVTDGIDGAFYLDALKRMNIKANRQYQAGEMINRVESGNKPSWEVYVPSSYDPSRPPGIMLYISPTMKAGVPKTYRQLMDKHNLIWVGANEAGNDMKSYSWRKSISVAGVNRIKERYKVNSDRIFLSGMSGGGRTASDVAIIYADLFKGSIYLCGVNSFPRTSSQMMKTAKNNHFVFLSGTNDFNLGGTKSVCSTYQRAKFLHTKLIVVEGLGHAKPSSEDFDTSIQFLDSLRKVKAETFYKDALKALKYKQLSKA
jgi:predicted esterase